MTDSIIVIHQDAKQRLVAVEGDGSHQRALTFESNLGLSNGCCARWEATEDEVRIETDSLGLSPLYSCTIKDRMLVSPSVAALLRAGAPADIDWKALAVFCRLGWFVGGDTPFQAIRRVPPGWNVRINRSGQDSSRFEPRVPETKLSEDALRIELGRRVRRAVQRRLEEGGGGGQTVPLSGGRDSRHILLALNELGARDVSTVTVRRTPKLRSDDATIAAQLSAAVGAAHREIRDGGFSAIEEDRKNEITNYGALDHGWMGTLAQAVGSAQAVWDGLGGDVLTAGLFYSDEQYDLARRGQTRAWAELIAPDTPERKACIDIAFGPWAESLGHRHAVDRLAEEMENHLHHHNPVTSFYFWNRTRGCVALGPMCFYRSVQRLMFPLLDLDVWELAFAMPAAIQRTKAFHTQQLRQIYPSFNHIPFAGEGRTFTERLKLLWPVGGDVSRFIRSDLPWSSRSGLLRAGLASAARNGKDAVTTIKLIGDAMRLSAYARSLARWSKLDREGERHQ